MANENQINVAIVSGRIEQIDQAEGRFYHRLALPAHDEFSNPGAALIDAGTRLGNVGDVLTKKCRVIGYSRGFQRRDGSKAVEVRTRFQPVD